LPWSEKRGADDKTLLDTSNFEGQDIVLTAKMDGENTTLYSDGLHARSLDSGHHPSREWVKGLWGRMGYMIPEGMRVCGESLYARHTVPYSNLRDFFYVHSIWEEEQCLSWDETEEWAELLGLQLVPVIWKGKWDEEKVRATPTGEVEGDPCEGYVVRLSRRFFLEDFSKSVAKFVRADFQIPGEHWMFQKITPNEIRTHSNDPN
jgi:hypothetical protein